MKGGEIKIKYENGGRRAENEIGDNYRFIFPVRVSHFRSVSKTVSVPEDLSYWCEWRTCHSRRGILDVQENFVEKFSAALGFLSGVVTFRCLLFHE
jgi:hypothetical protein